MINNKRVALVKSWLNRQIIKHNPRLIRYFRVPVVVVVVEPYIFHLFVYYSGVRKAQVRNLKSFFNISERIRASNEEFSFKF